MTYEKRRSQGAVRMMKDKDTVRIRANYSRALVLTLLSLGACLNSAVKNETGAGATTSSEVSGVSPSRVRLDWPDYRDAFNYRIFSGELGDDADAVASANFSYAEVPTAPDSLNELKVYKYDKSGAPISPQAVRHYKFETWPLFEDANPWTAAPRDYAGIEISWDHIPWQNALVQPHTGVQAKTLVRCFFLANGTLSSDPFTAGPGKTIVQITAPATDKKILAGNRIAPLTTYAIGCEMEYADGTKSRQSNLVRQVTSSRDVEETEDGVSLTVVPTSGIFVNRALSFLVNNANNGLLSLNAKYVNGDALEDEVLNFSRSDIEQNTLVRFDTPFPSIPGKVYGGRFRLQGSYLPDSPGALPQNVSAQDIYVKTADNIHEVIHSQIEHVYGPQAAGKATAVGDFNCDGHDDLAIGLPNAAWQDQTNVVQKTGIVIIYYGSVSGLQYSATAPQIDPEPPTLSSGNLIFPPVILIPPPGINQSRNRNNPTATIGFGASLAVGNFNRDYLSADNVIDGFNNVIGGRACMDLAIGMPNLRIDGSTPGLNAELPGAGGGVLIAYGTTSGLKNGGTTVVSNAGLDYGGACSGGDASLVAKHPSSSSTNTADKITPPFSTPNSNCAGTLFYPFAANAGHYACKSGLSTVPCSVPVGLSSTSTDKTAHAVTVPYYRSTEFSPVLPDTNAWDQGLSAQGSSFGFALGAGDFDGDGFDDLAVGAPNARAIYTEDARVPNSTVVRGGTVHESTGAVFVYMGSNSGLYQQRFSSATSSHTAECSFFSWCDNNVATNFFTGINTNTSPNEDQPQASPIKFTIPFLERVGGEQLGYSVAIANIDALDGRETRQSGSYLNTGTLWVGAPGANTKAGRVFVYRSFEGTDPARSIRPVQQSWAWRLDGAADEEFGSALVAGNFRDPRYGQANQPTVVTSVGLDMVSRNRFREAVAVGAPGSNSGNGRVYVYADAVSSSGFKLSNSRRTSLGASAAANNRVQQDLCTSASTCLGSIIPSPASGGRFGESLSTLRMPLQMAYCSAQDNCQQSIQGKISSNSALTLKWQPVFRTTKLDSLLVGAPTASAAMGRAFLYSGSNTAGLQASTAYEHAAISIAQGSASRFGASLAGGFFNYLWNNPGLAIGMPGQSKFGPDTGDRSITIGGGGSVALFQPASPSQATPTNSSIDLMLDTKNTDDPTADFFSISSLADLGHYRARGIGDVNCDGFSDAILPHYSAGVSGVRTELLVLYGSNKGLKLKRADGSSGIPVSRAPQGRLTGDSALGLLAPQWIDTSTWSDDTQGDTDPLKFFAGAGDVNGDGCGDLVVARKRFVVVHGSPSGLVLETPFGLGRNPKLISFPDAGSAKAVADASTITSLSAAIASASIVVPFNTTGTTVGSDTWGSLNSPPPTYATPLEHTHKDLGAGAAFGGPLSVLDPTLITWGGDWGDYNLGDMPGAKAPICHGDFNGDGYGDLALGSMTTGVAHKIDQPTVADASTQARWGISGNYPRAISGAIKVFYGSEQGIQTAVPEGLEYDYSLYLTASPDVNLEPVSPLNSKCSAGGCRPGMLFDPYLFVSGTKSTVAVSTAEKTYSPFRPLRTSQVTNIPTDGSGGVWSVLGDRFGELCATVGNLDNDQDGYDDLVIPLPRSVSRPQQFIVFKGSADGLNNNALPGGQPSQNAFLVKAVMGQNGGATLTNDSQFAAGTLGASISGLGDINHDRAPDVALGLPNLVGAGASSGIARNGGVLVVLGSTALTPLFGARPAEVFSTHSSLVELKVCDKAGAKSTTTGVLDPCSKSNPLSLGTEIPRGLLIRPDTINSSNRGRSFGRYVDAGGDVNADGFGDLLVPMPNYNTPGKIGIGAGLIYFGNESSQGHLSAGYVSSGTTYTPVAPSVSATCESYPLLGVNRCAPYLLTPEFATLGSAMDNQSWMVSGGFVLTPHNPDPNFPRVKFFDYGTRNTGSQDLTLKSSDLLLAPTKGTPYEYKPSYDHLGGLSVWY
jgi:hypothetical protein